jgi:hypothetical protein
MAFEKYYRTLTRNSGRYLPSADDARRDYQAAVKNHLSGMLYTR